MKPTSQNIITTFEHACLRLGNSHNDLRKEELEALQVYYGDQGTKFFSLIHQGIKFNQYVGVLQVGKRVIEVLPKADKKEHTAIWRQRLIGMLQVTDTIKVQNTGSSSLKIQANSILDLYFELLIEQLEQLLHRGLVKQYRQAEGNQNVLKGSLVFSKQVSKNLVHKERFFVRHNVYDRQHLIHQVLYKALLLVQQMNTYANLNNRIGRLLLYWPLQQNVAIYPGLFDKLVLSRKTRIYKDVLQIAKMLLLNYHPDVQHGRQDVLALMFDMNVLWERFVFKTLLKYRKPDMMVSGQQYKLFWTADNNRRSSMRPDIVIQQKDIGIVVLDTKWKQPSWQPSPDDLRQLYVYLQFFEAQKAALILPGRSGILSGTYGNRQGKEGATKEGSCIFISVEKEILLWQKEIAEKIFAWMYTLPDKS